MKITIPDNNRPIGLLIVDVQPNMMGSKVLGLTSKIAKFIESTDYDLYIEATWSADKKSTFFRQTHDIFDAKTTGSTAKEILQALRYKKSPVVKLHKNTRSAFKAKEASVLLKTLKRHNIKELHLVGIDINDCVLATALDATDLGFYTFVIEELSHHSKGIRELKESALHILRRVSMTNNSLQKGTPTKVVEI